MTSETDITRRITLPPPHPVSLTHAQRIERFGAFDYTPNPQPWNPERVEINHAWMAKNIAQIYIPSLQKRASVHVLAAPHFLAVFEAIAAAGLRDKILTVDGFFASRYKRGKTGGSENLSNHAWGTAVDLNARWNGLGHRPAGATERGSVLDLVPIFEQHGFAWGGRWNRPDGMHFELA